MQKRTGIFLSRICCKCHPSTGLYGKQDSRQEKADRGHNSMRLLVKPMPDWVEPDLHGGNLRHVVASSFLSVSLLSHPLSLC